MAKKAAGKSKYKYKPSSFVVQKETYNIWDQL